MMTAVVAPALAQLVLPRTRLKHLCRWLESVCAVVSLQCSARGVLGSRLLNDYFAAELSLHTLTASGHAQPSAEPVSRAFLCSRLSSAAGAFDKSTEHVRWLWYAADWEMCDAAHPTLPLPARHFYVELEQPPLVLRPLPADSEIGLRCMLGAEAMLRSLKDKTDVAKSKSKSKTSKDAAPTAAAAKPPKKRRHIAAEPLHATTHLHVARVARAPNAFSSFFQSNADALAVMKLGECEAARGPLTARAHNPRWVAAHTPAANASHQVSAPPLRVELANVESALTAVLGTHATKTLLKFHRVAPLLRLTMYKQEHDERVLLEFFEAGTLAMSVQLAPLLSKIN